MKLIWRGPQRWFSNYFIYCFSWRLKTTFLHFQVVSRDQNLTLPINDETIGKYYCHAETPGYASVTSRYIRPRNFVEARIGVLTAISRIFYRSAELQMTGIPKITSSASQGGVIGENVLINCAAISIPEAESVEWTYHNTVLDESKCKF